MSRKKTDEIIFEQVPSLAMIKYYSRFENGEDTKERFEEYLDKHGVKINPNYNGYRFVTHYWITREDIDTLITLIKNYAKN